MEKIKIIADSACDLDLDYISQLDVDMIPMGVSFGQEEFKDRVTITTKEFYQRIKTYPDMPKTSQIPPIEFLEHFKKYTSEGYNVICICFSSRLSGTYQSAVVAKDMLNSSLVDVIDSKGASVGYGLMVRKAAMMVKEGKTKNEIIDEVIFMRERMEHIFGVGHLDMLKKGGRLSRPQAVMGTLLGIKPILQFEDGYIVPYSKVRGDKAIIKKIIETMKERGNEIEKQEIIGLNYSEDDSLCLELKKEIEKTFGVKNFIISEIGTAIGSHVGGGTFSVFFLKK